MILVKGIGINPYIGAWASLDIKKIVILLKIKFVLFVLNS
jgi:hypothetical protein